MNSFNGVLEHISKIWLDLLVIIALGWIALYFGKKIISQLIRHAVRHTRFNNLSEDDAHKRQNTLIGLFRIIWKLFVLSAVGIIIFRKVFPTIDLTPLFASAGIVGIALGFGAQSIVKDFLTGIFIITENQYRVGDVVDLEGAAGTVERLGIRTTIVRDVDGNVHYIPNGNIMHVINKTMGYSKVNFTLSVDPDTDIDKLADIINGIGEAMAQEEAWQEKILEAPKFLNIGAFSELGMDVLIVGKTQPSAQWSVTGELRRRLLREFKKHRIELAQSAIVPWNTKKK